MSHDHEAHDDHDHEEHDDHAHHAPPPPPEPASPSWLPFLGIALFVGGAIWFGVSTPAATGAAPAAPTQEAPAAH